MVRVSDGKEIEMTMAIVLPMVGMVVIGAIYTGVYLWMRRASFGESGQNGQDSDL